MIQCYFEGGYQEIFVYLLVELGYGYKFYGFCFIIDSNSIILVELGCQVEVIKIGDICIFVGVEVFGIVGFQLDFIQLFIFLYCFMSIVEQMGCILQCIVIFINIKECLDFFCVFFGFDGGLVFNAPHIFVYLGVMQEMVQFQIQYLGVDFYFGDVLLSNYFSVGGSYLLDLIVIILVFWLGQMWFVFYVVS